MGLKLEAINIVSLWWTNAPVLYFERLVRIYKAVVAYFLTQQECKVQIYNYVAFTNCIKEICINIHISSMFLNNFILFTCNMQTITKERTMHVVLTMLKFLYKLNENVDNQKVPYDVFHFPDLTEYIDIKADYFNWLLEKDQTVSEKIVNVKKCELHVNNISKRFSKVKYFV